MTESQLVFETLTPAQAIEQAQRESVINFLFEHLEQYGDAAEDIGKCLAYALQPAPHPGGVVLTASENGQLVGAVIINRTGMDGYIPANILVYIAVHGNQRGNGLGQQLIERTFEATEGDIALHVEPDNPARRLYERLGFTNKYLEMRWQRK